LRLDEVKRLGADLSANVEEISAGELVEEMGGQIAFLEKLVPGASKLKSSRPRFFFENDEGKADLVVLCKQYLSYLERKVHRFLAAHGVAHDYGFRNSSSNLAKLTAICRASSWVGSLAADRRPGSSSK
jgi:hypothetical protein